MTDQEWNLALSHRGEKITVCRHINGDRCTAKKNGKCLALHNTDFGRKQCPFFRDKMTMTGAELDAYERMTSFDDRATK